MERHDQAQAEDERGLRRVDWTIWTKRREWIMRLGRALASWLRHRERVLVQARLGQVRAWAVPSSRYQPLLLVVYTNSLAHKHPRTIGLFVRI